LYTVTVCLLVCWLSLGARWLARFVHSHSLSAGVLTVTWSSVTGKVCTQSQCVCWCVDCHLEPGDSQGSYTVTVCLLVCWLSLGARWLARFVHNHSVSAGMLTVTWSPVTGKVCTQSQSVCWCVDCHLEPGDWQGLYTITVCLLVCWLWLVVHQPFDGHWCHMGTAIKHPLPDWVKSLFVIFDIQALWPSGLSVRVLLHIGNKTDCSPIFYILAFNHIKDTYS